MSDQKKTNIPGGKLFEIRKRMVITQAVVTEAFHALHEAGCETESEALSYAFSDLRKLLEEQIPGITPNSDPEPTYKNN